VLKTSSAPLWVTLLINVIISAIVGTLAGGLLFPVFGAVSQFFEYGSFDLKVLFIGMIASPLIIVVILPLLMPLIGMACLAALVFQKSIQKNLLVWCCVAPVSIWLAIIAFLVRTPLSNYYKQVSWFERILMNTINPDYFLFLIAPTISAFVFYKLSKRGLS